MAGPLSHIRALDLSRVLAGPWCGQNLADLGAEVIKIERPEKGDDSRAFGPPWLKDRSGRDTKEWAYLPSTRPAYDYRTNPNPRLVYGSVTGFGQTGPYRERPGYDFMIQGMGGVMSITGERDDLPGGGPQRVGIPIADIMTGMYATIAICAALAHRERSGTGQHLDLALLDTQVGILANQGMTYLATGVPPGRIGNAHPNIVPYQPFKTRDGDVILACGNDNLFNKFCEVAGCQHLARDGRFATNSRRVENREAITALLAEIFAKRATKEWCDSLEAAGVATGAITNLKQVFEGAPGGGAGLRIAA